MTSPMEYGRLVQDALRELILDRFMDRDSPVHDRAGLSRALGHGEARQYVASRFTPDSKSGKVRDLTVPDLLDFAKALGLDPVDLLRRAQAAVDAELATVTQLPTKPDKPTPKPAVKAARRKRDT